jgi:Fe-S oxidoreductase
MDQLMKYQFSKIFPGSRLLDIHEFLKEKGVKCDQDSNAVKYIYHDPCHTPIKKYDPLQITKELLDSEVVLSDRCCGESGTLAVSRPDISTQLRYRKLEEINKNIDSLSAQKVVKKDDKAVVKTEVKESPEATKIKIMTTCPACQQGLLRYNDDTNLEVDYIVVEMCNNILGENWQQEFIEKANKGGIERVLL